MAEHEGAPESSEPDPAVLAATGWVRAREAGDLLGGGLAQVGWLADTGRLKSVTLTGVWGWVKQTEVEALVAGSDLADISNLDLIAELT